MKASDNPFTLTFGIQPGKLIPRYEATEEIIETFRAEHPVNQAYLIEGIRGSGKTVLMTTVTNSLSADSEWICINLNSNMDLLRDFAVQLHEKCRKIPSLLEKGFSVSAFGVGGAEMQQESTALIREMLQLVKNKKRVLVTTDEVLPDKNMRVFVSQFQIFLREGFPVFLLMTGLYDNIYAVQNDPSLTFLLRTPKVRMEPLSRYLIKKQYREIFQTDDETASLLTNYTKGYAFAFQALGKVYWDSGEKSGVSSHVLEKLEEMLDGFVYQRIWADMSDNEQRIIRAMSESECKVGDICSRISMSSAVFSKYRERLIRRGILRSVRHGYLELTLPRFSIIAQDY